MRIFLFTLVLCGLATAIAAQSARSVHHTYDLDNVEQISLDLHGDVVVEHWESRGQVMVESYISIVSVKNRFLEGLINAGRYEVLSEQLPDSLHLSSKEALDRRLLNRRTGEQYLETVRHVVYLPNDFVEVAPGVYRRKEDELATDE